MKELNKTNGRRIRKYLLIILVIIVCEVVFWGIYIIRSNGDSVRLRSTAGQSSVVIDCNFHRGLAYQVTRYKTDRCDSADQADAVLERCKISLDKRMSEYHGYVARAWKKDKSVHVYEAADLRLLSRKQLEELGLEKYRNATRRQVRSFDK